MNSSIDYSKFKVSELRRLAQTELGIQDAKVFLKSQLVDLLTKNEEKKAETTSAKKMGAAPKRHYSADKEKMEPSADAKSMRPEKPEEKNSREYREETEENSMPEEMMKLDSGNVAYGLLEVLPDGFGFIRSDNYMPGENDVYVAPSQIRRFQLQTGDIISGSIRKSKEKEKFQALLYVNTVNGQPASAVIGRPRFEDLTPIFPNERISLTTEYNNYSLRLMDFIAPIGKGQRGMIVSPPKAGKTTLLKKVANAITQNHPEINLIVLLIDERPDRKSVV